MPGMRIDYALVAEDQGLWGKGREKGGTQGVSYLNLGHVISLTSMPHFFWEAYFESEPFVKACLMSKSFFHTFEKFVSALLQKEVS